MGIVSCAESERVSLKQQMEVEKSELINELAKYVHTDINVGGGPGPCQDI